MDTVHIQEHFKILGFKVRDTVTGFSGVATSLCFDLYGCVQVTVNPGLNAEGKFAEAHWLDIARLEITDTGRVMNPPSFEFGLAAKGRKGPAEKPALMKP